MIVREFYKTLESGVNLYKTYSDSNLYIQKVGTDEVYAEAIDVEDSNFQYIETTSTISPSSEDGSI